MKKVNPFFKILFVFFLIFIALYIALESGYYDVKMGKKAKKIRALKTLISKNYFSSLPVFSNH